MACGGSAGCLSLGRCNGMACLVSSHMLDSGAFSLKPRAEKHARKTGDKWGYYSTKAFYRYLDAYAAFVKEYRHGIDVYANLDVIGSPELTWRNQVYLEREHGLAPFPVVHYGTGLDWLVKYVEAGYQFIGIGGMVGKSVKAGCKRWLDQAFSYVCPPNSYYPRVRLHAFGVTRHDILIRYPWWSADSTDWVTKAAYGVVLVPPKRNGVFLFREKAPHKVRMSGSRDSLRLGRNYAGMTRGEKAVVNEWLEKVGLPLGRWDGDKVTERGVTTCGYVRRAANVFYFEELRRALPAWPWPFRVNGRRGLWAS